jgi:hypothetical protein
VSAPLSITLSAGLAAHVGIRTTFVVAGVAAAVCSLGALLLLLRSGEPAPQTPTDADSVTLAA